MVRIHHCNSRGTRHFRQLYAAGYMARTGQAAKLYDYAAEKLIQDVRIGPEQIALPFNHLSYEAFLFAPFTFLTYQWAWFAFLAFNVLLLVVSFRLLNSYLGNLASSYRWAPAVLFFTFLSVSIHVQKWTPIKYADNPRAIPLT